MVAETVGVPKYVLAELLGACTAYRERVGRELEAHTPGCSAEVLQSLDHVLRVAVSRLAGTPMSDEVRA